MLRDRFYNCDPRCEAVHHLDLLESATFCVITLQTIQTGKMDALCLYLFDFLESVVSYPVDVRN